CGGVFVFCVGRFLVFGCVVPDKTSIFLAVVTICFVWFCFFLVLFVVDCIFLYFLHMFFIFVFFNYCILNLFGNILL
ncbi:hypothetical protein L2E41_23975, partial [Salmonella enterica subsp. enterica serovar Weltevreden]|uniref:hypothetical protein n=1 Tax=Salmonella enterica TaxID=28901 RepID=UPI001F192887